MPPKKQPENEDQLSLDILSEVQSIQEQSSQQPARRGRSAGRSELVDSRNFFTSALKSKKVSGEGIRNATSAMYQGMGYKNAAEMYKEFGAPAGDREGLPPDQQRRIGVHETLNGKRVMQHDVQSQTQWEVDNEVTEVVYEQTQQTEGFFKKFKLFG